MTKNEQIKILIGENGMLDVYANPEKYGLTAADIHEYDISQPSPRAELINFLNSKRKA